MVLASKLGILLIGFTLSVAHSADAVQRFDQQPSYTEVNPGQDALLVCKVFNKRGSCSWQKDNKPVGMYQHKYEWAAPQQDSGDCSIWVRAAQLEFDDGNWECQVTASDFHTQDALTSSPVKLVVRVPPQRPRIEYNNTQVLPGHNLTALHGEVGVIRCKSHYGNPPPILKWFLDQNEITPTRRQSNSTEADNPRTWLAISTLELTISKENHGKTLRCVAIHESYSTKSSSIEVRLDVMFLPETRLLGIPTTDIEELKDSVAIRCMVSANPKAAVVWKREGQTQPASMQELLQFSPAVRQHAGLYTCQARNKAGESQPVRVHVDVKYPPKILSVGPDRLTTTILFSSTTFECIAEGNPQPTYQWLQRVPSPSNRILERGRESKLHIANVTYDFQGEYVCKVTNIISGTERIVQSEAIALQVVGAPQVLRHSATPETFVEKGDDVEISLVVCADPRPRVVAWEWGSLRLEAGSEMGRYSVDEVVQEEREDCYLTTLKIRDTEATDSRAYYLAVENDRGTDRHAVKLYVNEPLQMSTLVSLAGVSMAIMIILVCMFIYAIKAEKCCFARKGDFKPSDLESEKLDLEKTVTGPGGIPADAIYTTTPRGGRSPEAMKPATTLTFNGRSSVIGGGGFGGGGAGGGCGGENVYAGIGSTRRLTLPSPIAYESDNEVEVCQRSGGGVGGCGGGGSSGRGSGGIYVRKSRSYNKYNAIDAPRESHARTSLPSGGGGRRHHGGRRSDAAATAATAAAALHMPPARPKPLQADCEKYYEHIFPSRQSRGRQSYNDVYYQPNSIDHAEL